MSLVCALMIVFWFLVGIINLLNRDGISKFQYGILWVTAIGNMIALWAKTFY